MQSETEMRNTLLPALAWLAGNARLVALLFLASALYLWNAFNVPFGSGYDEIGHAAYIHTIAAFRTIPHPLSGWSTFHPPLYYLLASAVWTGLDVLGPSAVVVGVRALGALALILAGVSAHAVLRRGNCSEGAALTSVTMLLMLPFVVYSASWIGNEALLAGVSALTCLCIASVAAHRGSARYALGSGLLCGLAFGTKYTGRFALVGLTAAAIDIPGRRVLLRTLIGALLGFSIVAGPVLIRNIGSTGVAFPMTRHLAPIAMTEEITHVERRLGDYLVPAIETLTEPTIFDQRTGVLNEHMANVWGLTYVSAWYDPFGHRVPGPASSGLAGLVLLLGLIPTSVMLFGFVSAVRGSLRPESGGLWVPLVLMSLAGMVVYLAWTWRSATLVAVKASYLVPLLVPAAAFFARGLDRCPRPVRLVAIALTLLAASASGVTYAEGLVYQTPLREEHVGNWKYIGAQLPWSGIQQTITWWEGR